MNPLPFVPHEGPLADFLITTRDSANLRRWLTALGARAIDRDGHAVYLWRFPEGKILLAGTALIDGHLVVGPTALDAAPGRITAGSCALLDLQQKDTRIRSDPFGMHPIFHSSHLVTNRLHLAAIILGGLDVSAALSSIHSDGAFCQQLGTVGTPVAGTSLLLTHQHIEVGSQVRLVSEELDKAYDPIGPAEYRRLIQQGAEDLRENVNAVLDSGEDVRAALTGGRDSRLMLGALVSLGRVRDVTFITSDIGDDLNIATGLVKRFGGTYVPPHENEFDFLVCTLRQRKLARRSQLFGAYHLVKESHFRTAIVAPTHWRIQMDGGCGELYRDFYQKSFSSEYHGLQYDRDTATRMLHKRWAWKDVWPDHFAQIAAPYLDTFDVLPGGTIGQKLDSHYLNFRNRMHFGLRMSSPVRQTGIHPLCSPTLLRAARGLPQREKATGRILFDVTRALCEELPYLPYDHPWEADFTSSPYHTPSRFDGMVLELQPARGLAAKKTTVAAPKRPPTERIDLREFCFASAMELVGTLRSTGGPFAHLETEALVRRLRWAYEKRQAPLFTWYSRLQAFADYEEILST